MIERLELTDKDREAVKRWLYLWGFKAKLAEGINQQGWISEKQRFHLHSEDWKPRRVYSYAKKYKPYSRRDNYGDEHGPAYGPGGPSGPPDGHGNGYCAED